MFYLRLFPKAEFKVYPETFFVRRWNSIFSDTYKTRAAVPALSYVEKSVSLENVS